jgi:hypothetical protein
LCCRKGTALSRAGDVYRPQQNLQQHDPQRWHSGSLIVTASPRGHELPDHSTQQPKYSLGTSTISIIRKQNKKQFSDPT